EPRESADGRARETGSGRDNRFAQELERRLLRSDRRTCRSSTGKCSKQRNDEGEETACTTRLQASHHHGPPSGITVDRPRNPTVGAPGRAAQAADVVKSAPRPRRALAPPFRGVGAGYVVS